MTPSSPGIPVNIFTETMEKLPHVQSTEDIIQLSPIVALLSRADAKVKELRQSFETLKAEAEKLEKTASQADDEMMRARTKLRQAGKQIQGVVRSAYKIERQARGLKEVLRELPSIEASRFQSQVSNLAKKAKKEKNVLNKEITRISNYGISVLVVCSHRRRSEKESNLI